ncbi:TPA: hypothetical protein ACJ51G_001119 [Aeromonas hydrophila subsp. hydrophila]
MARQQALFMSNDPYLAHYLPFVVFVGLFWAIAHHRSISTKHLAINAIFAHYWLAETEFTKKGVDGHGQE